MNIRVLVDSDPFEESFLTRALHGRNYEAVASNTIHPGGRTVANFSPDVVLLNIKPPLQVAQQKIWLLKELGPIVVVGMVTPSEALAFPAGAIPDVNHFIFRPFQLDQLEALLRILALKAGSDLDKSATSAPRMVPLGNGHGRNPWPNPSGPLATAPWLAPADRGQCLVQFDHEQRDVLIAGHRLNLSPKEYKLFALLAQKSGGLCSEREIIRQLWPGDVGVSDVDVRQYIFRIRRKLTLQNRHGQLLRVETVKSQGYRLLHDFCPLSAPLHAVAQA